MYYSPPLEATLARLGIADIPVRPIFQREIPEPFMPFLIQNNGMTRNLQGRLGAPIGLSVVRSSFTSLHYLRHSILMCLNTKAALECAAIDVNVSLLPTQAAEMLAANTIPFGAILSANGIDYRSNPIAFFDTDASYLSKAFKFTEASGIVYGRWSILTVAKGAVIADTVEILLPTLAHIFAS